MYFPCDCIPRERIVVATEPAELARSSREQLAEILFEQFNAPACAIQRAGVLALYAAGLTTGLAIDCGNSLSITPVADGYVIPHGCLQAALGGRAVDEAFVSELVSRYGGAYAADSFRHDMIRFKEAHGFVAGTAAASALSCGGVRWRFHTGAELIFDSERFRCPETLFTADLPGGCKGLSNAVAQCAAKCGPDLRRPLLGNIVLAGGTTCCSGLPARLQADLEASVMSFGSGSDSAVGAKVPKVRIRAPKNRRCAVAATAFPDQSFLARKP
eukprot:SAG31_NODE_3956_length_3720_cov_1.296879_4_plen_272_part_00